MKFLHSHNGALSPVSVLAGVSFVALLVTIGWRGVEEYRAAKPKKDLVFVAAAAASSDSADQPSSTWQQDLVDLSADKPVTVHDTADADGIGNIASNVIGTLANSYAFMRQSGSFADANTGAVTEQIAKTLEADVSHASYRATDLSVDPDTSYQRMLAYRSDMRVALEPLLRNTDYELKLYANYIGSNDAQYLDALKKEIDNYHEAIANTARVKVPLDMLTYHANVLNALSGFVATIEAMIAHTDDPFASAALLRTYQSSEKKMFDAFNALAQYERAKQP